MSLTGHHLRVAILHDPPNEEIVRSVNGSVEYRGISANIFHSFHENLNFSYELIEEDVYGTYKNGVSTGAVNLVHEGRVDLVAAIFYHTPQRSQVVEYLFPCFMDQQILLMNRKNLVTSKDDTNFLLQPFSSSVWMSIILMVVVTSLSLLAIGKLTRLVHPNTNGCPKPFDNYTDIIENLLRILLQQGLSVRFAAGPARCIISGCWLATIVLTASYVGQYVAIRTVTNHFHLKVESVEELAKSTSVKPITGLGFSTLDTLDGTHHGRKVLEKINSCSECLVDTTTKAIDVLTSSEDYVYIGYFKASKYLMAAKYSEDRSCNLVMSTNNNPQMYGSFIVPKGSKYKQLFNKHILGLVGGGIINKWVQTYYPTEDKCFTVSGSPRLPSLAKTTSSLGLDAAFSMFTLWAVGLALAAFTLTLEHLMVKVKTSRRLN